MERRTVSVRPVPAAWMDSTAARMSRSFWKLLTRSCREFVFTLPSMRMYRCFVLRGGACWQSILQEGGKMAL